MFSSGEMDNLINQVINQLGQKKKPASQTDVGVASGEPCGGAGGSTGGATPRIPITASEILVVLGLLGGVLEVSSVLVDKNQIIEFVLTGSLKRPTRLDKMMDEIGKMPFDDVLKAVFDRLG